jgi:hypothetical protein
MPVREHSVSVIPTFDIFRGHYQDKDATWVGAAEGLGKARERMKQIATEKPGAYFVFSCHDRLVLDILTTAKRPSRLRINLKPLARPKCVKLLQTPRTDDCPRRYARSIQPTICYGSGLRRWVGGVRKMASQ